MAGTKDQTSAEFTALYLQRATKEFAHDLDEVRGKDDFKGDALPMLIKGLSQGTALYSSAEQKRILEATKNTNGKKGSNGDDEDQEMSEA
jgi:ribosome assembly protein 3